MGNEFADFPVIVLPSEDVPLTVLLQDWDIPKPHANEGQYMKSFTPKLFSFHGPKQRPVLVLPMRSKIDSTLVAPVTFLVDTGAPRSFITPATVKLLGLRTEYVEVKQWFYIYCDIVL